MKTKTDLEYLRLNKFLKFWYSFARFWVQLPGKIWGKLKGSGRWIAKKASNAWNDFLDIGTTFKNGDWKTRTSYFVMGFGSIARGQWLRGILFLGMEVVFVLYMILVGAPNLAQLGSLGDVAVVEKQEWSVIKKDWVTKTVYVDNSFKILLYGVLTIFFILALIYTWRVNVRQNKISEQILATGKPIKSSKDDVKSLLDNQFHATLLSLPLLGIFIFTVLPTFFMILIAFTNYSGPSNLPPKNLFDWVGLDNFNSLFTWSTGGTTSFGATFGEVLVWTLIWAFFATFSNYFLGMIVALLINKKGIKLKKLWRSILVLTIAIPQFISLLYISKMFGSDGVVNGTLFSLGWIDKPLPFWTNATWAKVTVIVVNIWVGIPYLMLMISGVLMNIPADLYESSRVDGANAVQQYFKITLPYTLFVTGPYLLTSFIGNMNNFNVIYLLTGGGPEISSLKAGKTSLLITWLYALTVEEQKYNLAAVIGILIFVVVALLSVVVYNLMPSVKNEEDYQ